VGLSWCLAQFFKSSCDREHEATACDAAAGQAGLAGCPAELLSPCIHHPLSCLLAAYTAAGKPNILLPLGKTQQLPSLHLPLLVLCAVGELFPPAPGSVRGRLHKSFCLSMSKWVLTKHCTQWISFRARWLAPTASASAETGKCGWLAEVPAWGAQQPRASSECRGSPRVMALAAHSETVAFLCVGCLDVSHEACLG